MTQAGAWAHGLLQVRPTRRHRGSALLGSCRQAPGCPRGAWIEGECDGRARGPDRRRTSRCRGALPQPLRLVRGRQRRGPHPRTGKSPSRPARRAMRRGCPRSVRYCCLRAGRSPSLQRSESRRCCVLWRVLWKAASPRWLQLWQTQALLPGRPPAPQPRLHYCGSRPRRRLRPDRQECGHAARQGHTASPSRTSDAPSRVPPGADQHSPRSSDSGWVKHDPSPSLPRSLVPGSTSCEKWVDCRR